MEHAESQREGGGWVGEQEESNPRAWVEGQWEGGGMGPCVTLSTMKID